MDVVLLVLAYLAGSLGFGIAFGRLLAKGGYTGEPTAAELRLIALSDASAAARAARAASFDVGPAATIRTPAAPHRVVRA